MKNLNTPWEAQIDWAPDFPKGSYVFDSHGNELVGPIGGVDACLIAAAPDMLAALIYEAEMGYCDANGDWQHKPGYDPQVTASAIAKAKGE